MTPDKNSQIAELNYIQSVRHHARLEALEEAAKIAETLQAKAFEIPGGGLYARPPAAEDIAAAIRERAKDHPA